jgi:hypothetical protein
MPLRHLAILYSRSCRPLVEYQLTDELFVNAIHDLSEVQNNSTSPKLSAFSVRVGDIGGRGKRDLKLNDTLDSPLLLLLP